MALTELKEFSSKVYTRGRRFSHDVTAGERGRWGGGGVVSRRSREVLAGHMLATSFTNVCAPPPLSFCLTFLPSLSPSPTLSLFPSTPLYK